MFQRRLKQYFFNRLVTVALLWAGVALVVMLGPLGVAVIQDAHAPSPWTSLSVFADWRLPLVLIPGVGLVQLMLVCRARLFETTAVEGRRALTLSRKSWDEVSGALTHVACASLMLRLMERSFDARSVAAIALGLTVALIAYDVPEALPQHDGQLKDALSEPVGGEPQRSADGIER